MRAREVFGQEKDEWWKRADAAYSAFPNYRARAGRDISVFVIEVGPLPPLVLLLAEDFAGPHILLDRAVLKLDKWIATRL
jgi:F420H(2)-dependent quinone reductase